jgi:hypothetical protein
LAIRTSAFDPTAGLALAALSPYDAPCVSVAFRYDQSRKWVIVRASGVLGIDEVLRLIATARNDVAYRMWPMMFDARSATTTATEADIETAVQAVTEAMRSEGPRGHVALVADDDLLYERMLLYESRCADSGVRLIRAFRNSDEAERWLDIVSAARYFQS